MGMYIRKGIKIGPFRFNVSKSGIGTSFGVKGARVGLGPKGAYVHAGRGGVYYRKQLHGKSPEQAPNTDSQQPRLPDQPQVGNNLQKIQSADVSEMAGESTKDFLNELNSVIKYKNKATIFLMLGIVGIGVMVFNGVPNYLLAVGSISVLVIWLLLLRRDMRLNKFYLQYELEDFLGQAFTRTIDDFKTFANSERVWNINAYGTTEDLKRSGGASTSFDRKLIKPSLSVPARVKCNLNVPTLPAGDETLYLFPDRILVFQKGKFGAVTYSDLEIELSESNFLEEDSIPRDAKQVGTTWKYVNKKGGPDKRFKGNYEIPIMRYGEIRLKSKSGLDELFMLSNSDAGKSLETGLNSLRSNG